jgi:type I restriction enzyme S subunit
MLNDNLLQQAQLLFQSWFVDYTPFGGQRPNDWTEGVFADIVDFSNGYAFKGKELLDAPQSDCYRVFKQGHIFRGGGFNPEGTKSWYPRCKADGLKRYVLKKGDILMAMTDMKDNVQILGNTAIMEVDDQYIVNQRVGVLRCKKELGISYPYIFLLTNDNEFLLDLRSRANSGVQVNLSSTEIKNSPIYIAPRHVYDEFTNIVLPMFETIISNDIQNQQLAELRDTLLPKLMSGEISVKDIN